MFATAENRYAGNGGSKLTVCDKRAICARRYLRTEFVRKVVVTFEDFDEVVEHAEKYGNFGVRFFDQIRPVLGADVEASELCVVQPTATQSVHTPLEKGCIGTHQR
jgi:hypothetical protein